MYISYSIGGDTIAFGGSGNYSAKAVIAELGDTYRRIHRQCDIMTIHVVSRYMEFKHEFATKDFKDAMVQVKTWLLVAESVDNEIL